jgi:hypothetical protein
VLKKIHPISVFLTVPYILKGSNLKQNCERIQYIANLRFRQNELRIAWPSKLLIINENVANVRNSNRDSLAGIATD